MNYVVVAGLVSSLEGLLSTTLGSGYSKLNFVYDLTKNKWNASALRYGVIPGRIVEGDDIIGASTFDQSFTIIVTNQWSINQVDDSDKQTKIINLFDKCHDIVDQITDTKIDPSKVVIVLETEISEPDLYEQDRVVAIRITISIKYRIT